MKYIVVDVGCLECGNVSTVLGLYNTLSEAKTAHPEATLIRDENNVRFAESQIQILTFSPTAT